MFDIIVVRQLFHEVHNMCWCWKSTKKTGQFSWFAFGLDGRNTQISPAVRGPRSDVGGGGGGDDDDDDAKTAGATPQPPMRTTPSTTAAAAAAAMMPIRREGMAVCETCGAVGVKDTYYTRERRFCSQQVRVTELSTVEFSFVFSLFFSFFCCVWLPLDQVIVFLLFNSCLILPNSFNIDSRTGLAMVGINNVSSKAFLFGRNINVDFLWIKDRRLFEFIHQFDGFFTGFF